MYIKSFFILTLLLTGSYQAVGDNVTPTDVHKTASPVVTVSAPSIHSHSPIVKKKSSAKHKISVKKTTTKSHKHNTPVKSKPVQDQNTTPSQSTSTAQQNPTSQTTPATQQSPTTSIGSTSNESGVLAIEKEVVRLVNAERSNQGLKPLVLDNKLCNVARTKSLDMKTKNYFDHQSPTYGSPFQMMSHFGIQYQTAGENIAAGQRTAAEVMQSWMNSQGHRENILNPSFTHIGVGYVSGGNYGSYWTQMFTG